MPLGTVYHSKPMIRTSSTSSGNEESSAKDKPSGRKTKKYVKKKGETRKRNSNDISEGKNAAELADEILKKLDNMVIKNEIDNSPDLQGTSSNEFLKLGEKIAIKETVNKKNEDDIENVKKIENSGKSCSTAESEGSKVGGKMDEMNGELKGKKEYSEITKKDSIIEFANNKSKEKDSSKYILGVMEKDLQKFQKKNVDEVKTAVQQQQEDRQKMHILKGVTKFSKKFMKAIKKLENDHLNKDSSSSSDSSESSSTDSFIHLNSSSCSCSSCSESESSTCTCSDCCSEKSSTCSCNNSNLESSETSSSSFSSLTSSESSISSTSSTSTSKINSPII